MLYHIGSSRTLKALFENIAPRRMWAAVQLKPQAGGGGRGYEVDTGISPSRSVTRRPINSWVSAGGSRGSVLRWTQQEARHAASRAGL